MTIREEVAKSDRKACWLTEYNCPCMTAVCRVVPLPDEGCWVYRWFKRLINEDSRDKKPRLIGEIMKEHTENYLILKPIAEHFSRVASEITDDDIK